MHIPTSPADDLDAPDRRLPQRVTVPTPRLDIHLSVDDRKFDRVIELLETILTRVKRLEAQGVRTMATLAELKTKADTILVDVESETDIVTSIETLLDGQTALIAELKVALDNAILNNDPAALAAVSDALDNIGMVNAFNKARASAAVVKNTPAAP